MDIPVLAVAIISSLLLTRQRALTIVPIVWAIGLAMVAWGPAHNSNVHLDSLGFWGPWTILLAICCGIVFGVTALRERRSDQAPA
jgi:predicted membrane protein